MKKWITALTLSLITTLPTTASKGGIFYGGGSSPENGSPYIYFINQSSRHVQVQVQFNPFGASLNPFSYSGSPEVITYRLSPGESHQARAQDHVEDVELFATLNELSPAAGSDDQDPASQHGYLYSNHAAAPGDTLNFYTVIKGQVKSAPFLMNKTGSADDQDFYDAGIRIQSQWKNNGTLSGWLFIISTIEADDEYDSSSDSGYNSSSDWQSPSEDKPSKIDYYDHW